ncbi:ATP-binding protein [Actinosynnema sp. NPDC023794]
MNESVHVLPLFGGSTDPEVLDALRRCTKTHVDKASQLGGIIDLVLLFSAGSAHFVDGRGGALVDAILEGFVDAGAADLPVIVPVPGPGDVCSVPQGRMLFDALVNRWPEIGERLWSGEQEDVLEGIEGSVFSSFNSWRQGFFEDPPFWRSGALPGEGSFLVESADRSLGIAVVNSVFRDVDGRPLGGRGTLVSPQLDKVAGGSWESWVNQNDLTIVASGVAVPPPDLLDGGAPTLLIAGQHLAAEQQRGQRNWFVVNSENSALLRIEFSDERPTRVEEISGSRSRGVGLLRTSNKVSTKSRSETDLSDGADAEQALSEFYRQLESGQMIAVVVSGLDGSDAGELDSIFHQLAIDAFGRMPQPQPTQDEIWRAARDRLSESQLTARFQGLAGVDGVNYPDLYRVFNSPWWRTYDFSATGASRSLVSAFPSMLLTNAIAEKPAGRKGAIEIIVMNGSFDGGVESVEFGSSLLESATARSMWFHRLKAELACHPVVFFADSAHSASLWNVLASLTVSSGQDYPRFVVAPKADLSTASRLKHNDLIHIAESPTEFSRSRLLPGDQRLLQGKRRLTESLAIRNEATGISLVSTMLGNMKNGSKEFLKGREPDWGDITGSFAATLSMTDRVLRGREKFASGAPAIVLLRGGAGSGKTTAMMQCAHQLHRDGKVVGWIDRSATKSLEKIRAEAAELELDAIFVDDVDIFGRGAAEMMREFARGGKTVVFAAVRSTRIEFIPSALPAVEIYADDPLDDDDLKALIKVLKSNGLDGVLKRYKWSPEKRMQKLREMCERSLLAAMIQIVTGKPFEEKVKSEFEELDSTQAQVYAAVCILESAEVYKSRGIDFVDLLQVVSQGAAISVVRDAIRSLVRSRLVVQDASGLIRCRQRAIADTVVQVVLKKRPELMGSVVKELLYFYAGYAGHIRDSNDPYRRTMIRLLNHTMMIDLRLPDAMVRDVYDSVLVFLEDDFHYWLQRGEFELQRNCLDVAANYFQAARGCGGDGDYKVDTGWASVTLRRSARYPEDSAQIRAALDVLKTLEGVCRSRGTSSEHSFVVMIRVGTEWLEKVHKSLLDEDFSFAVGIIRGVIDLGRKIRLRDNNLQFDGAMRAYEPRLMAVIDRHQGIPT